MKDSECIPFLQWVLPELRMRWQGFRKVRKQVCRRIDRRIRELGLADVFAYRTYLEQHKPEWLFLDSLCRIPISRFYRDRRVFDVLGKTVIPRLARTAAARGEDELRFWSIGCASGEEPYTLALLWILQLARRHRNLRMQIIATDAAPTLIARARRGCYGASSLKDLPKAWRDRAFSLSQGEYCIGEAERRLVAFGEQDVRTDMPADRFHLILCRNVVFTYFDELVQRSVTGRLRERLLPGGMLILGIHERLPPGTAAFVPWSEQLGMYSTVDENQDSRG